MPISCRGDSSPWAEEPNRFGFPPSIDQAASTALPAAGDPKGVHRDKFLAHCRTIQEIGTSRKCLYTRQIQPDRGEMSFHV